MLIESFISFLLPALDMLTSLGFDYFHWLLVLLSTTPLNIRSIAIGAREGQTLKKFIRIIYQHLAKWTCTDTFVNQLVLLTALQ
jgi:hypothetical protein